MRVAFSGKLSGVQGAQVGLNEGQVQVLIDIDVATLYAVANALSGAGKPRSARIELVFENNGESESDEPDEWDGGPFRDFIEDLDF